MNNLTAGYSGIGATYTAEIPGTTAPATGIQNNSARFTGTDLRWFVPVIISVTVLQLPIRMAISCITDFAPLTEVPVRVVVLPHPKHQRHQSIPYNTPAYSESQPMGAGITLNSNSGLLQGIAPAAGQYVVTVCVEETEEVQ